MRGPRRGSGALAPGAVAGWAGRATCRLAGLVIFPAHGSHATRPALEGGRGARFATPGEPGTGGTGEERAGRRAVVSTAR
jgi:hypothetical protein